MVAREVAGNAMVSLRVWPAVAWDVGMVIAAQVRTNATARKTVREDARAAAWRVRARRETYLAIAEPAGTLARYAKGVRCVQAGTAFVRRSIIRPV